MAPNDAKQPLLSGLTDPRPPSSNGHAPNRRRLRRVRSAPLADCVLKDVNCSTPFPRSPSFFGNLHPSFCKVAIFLAVYLGVGTVCFSIGHNQVSGKKTNGILDAVYFCVVTMTTVGYGDIVPNSVFTKLVACALVFSGMALVGLILSSAADYLVEKQELLLVKAFYKRKRVGNNEILKEAESHRARYKLYSVSFLIVVLILAGTVFLVTVEKLDPIDAFYCVCSTITTLGYGDQSFSTKSGRVFAIFWILASTVCLAQFFLYIAELNTENRQRALANWVLTRKTTNIDLEAADLDENGVVSAAEFIIYKLKEMGKISQEDISLVMEEFEDLDVDQSGTLSASDINLAQSTETKE